MLARLFDWLFSEPEPPPESECLRFLRGLSACEEPTVSFRRSIGYLYVVKLQFREVDVTLEFNIVRRRWSLDVRDEQTHRALYHAEPFARTDRACVDFLMGRFNLWEKFYAMEAEDREKAWEKSRQEAELKAKYLTAKAKAEPLDEL